MKILTTLLLCSVALSLSACGTNAIQRAATGGMSGAAVGGPVGALVGAGVGVATAR